MPFLVRWPLRVKPGVSEALIGHIDLLASLANLTGQKLPPGDAPDSVDILAALLGQTRQGRDVLVEHAGILSLRQGRDKYIEPGNGPKRNAATNTELGNEPKGQLYLLSEDPGETNNVLDHHPGKAASMSQALQTLRKKGHSRPQFE